MEETARDLEARVIWRFVHNAIVHPMMAFPWTPRWVLKLHDWTSSKDAMTCTEREPQRSPRGLPSAARVPLAALFGMLFENLRHRGARRRNQRPQ
jgi:hypothetical protein